MSHNKGIFRGYGPTITYISSVFGIATLLGIASAKGINGDFDKFKSDVDQKHTIKAECLPYKLRPSVP